MIKVLLVIHLLIALAMVGVILMQRSEGGALGIGGGPGGFMTGRQAGNLLTRTTAILAAIFMVTSLSLAFLASKDRGPAKSLFDQTVPAEPGVPGPAPLQPLPLPSADGVAPLAPAPLLPAPPPAPEGSAPAPEGSAPAATPAPAVPGAEATPPSPPASPADGGASSGAPAEAESGASGPSGNH